VNGINTGKWQAELPAVSDAQGRWRSAVLSQSANIGKVL
jgi:hypothetical protein